MSCVVLSLNREKTRLFHFSVQKTNFATLFIGKKQKPYKSWQNKRNS